MRLFPDRIPPLRRIQLDLTQKSHLILIKPHSITIQFELNLGFPSQPTNQPTNQPITNPPTHQPTNPAIASLRPVRVAHDPELMPDKNARQWRECWIECQVACQNVG